MSTQGSLLVIALVLATITFFAVASDPPPLKAGEPEAEEPEEQPSYTAHEKDFLHECVVRGETAYWCQNQLNKLRDMGVFRGE